MGHDHAASERERQLYEFRAAVSERDAARRECLVLEGAVRRIADNTSDAQQVAKDALEVVRVIRSPRR